MLGIVRAELSLFLLVVAKKLKEMLALIIFHQFEQTEGLGVDIAASHCPELLDQPELLVILETAV